MIRTEDEEEVVTAVALVVVFGTLTLAALQAAKIPGTLNLVLFLLVLRRLPDRFERGGPTFGTGFRVAVSAAVGVFVLTMAIAAAKKKQKYVGICGQGPSDHPDLAEWLMEQGIDSVSLNPDSVLSTWLHLAGEQA